MPEAAAKAPKTQSPNAPGTFCRSLPWLLFQAHHFGHHGSSLHAVQRHRDKSRPYLVLRGREFCRAPDSRKPHFEPVTLSYGFTESKDLWKWAMSSVNQPVQRKNVSKS